MRTVLLIASGCLTAAAALPYIVAILWGWTLSDILHAIARPAALVREPAARPAGCASALGHGGHHHGQPAPAGCSRGTAGPRADVPCRTGSA